MPKPKHIHTKLPYLLRDDLYLKEKPYCTDFSVEDIPGAQATNHRFDSQELVIRDAQGQREDFTLEKNGFCFLRSENSLTPRKADDKVYVREGYFSQLEEVLHTAFPEYERIEYLDHLVRMRDAAFPSRPGELVGAAQPAALPHSDFSTPGGFLAMGQFFPGQEKYYKDRDFDLLNVWKVLRGPNNDWPLALCDYQSVDMDNDVTISDVLHEHCLGENLILFKNPQHSWYYLSDQDEDDLIVFRNADSKGARATAFHAAFDTGSKAAPPRHSIELRVAAFRFPEIGSG